MKTIYNKTIIAAMALVFTVSCQGLQDITTPEGQGEDTGTVVFKSVSVPVAAGVQTVTSAGLFAGEPINMYNVRLDISSSGQVTPQTPVKWAPGQIKSTDFLAYSPYNERYSSSSEELKFTVKTNQSTAEASAASDLLVAQALSKPADGAVALDFAHKLSQIKVFFDNKTGKDITKVTFASLVDNVVLDLNTGNVTTGSSVSDIVAYNDASLGCHTVIVPAGTFALELKITLSDGTVLSRTTKELSFAEGKTYDNAKDPLVLENTVVETIGITLAVSDWTFGGNVSFDEYECSMEISVSDITYDSAIISLTPTDVNAYYLTERFTKAIFEQNFASDDEFISYLLESYYNSFGNTYSEYGFSSYEELVLQGLAYQGEIGFKANNLTPETEYIQVCFFIDENINPIYGLTKKEFTTAAKPGADPEYTALLGTYTFSAYSYSDKASVTGNLLVTEGVVNESYKVAFQGCKWSPDYYEKYGSDYIDYFVSPWDKTNKTITLVNGTKGSFGMNWGYGNLGSCGIRLDLFYYNTEAPDFNVVLSPDASGNLVAISPAVPEGDYICAQSGIYNEEGDTGYAANSIFIFNNGMNFTKQAVASVNKVQHSVFEMPRLLGKQTLKAHKAIR